MGAGKRLPVEQSDLQKCRWGRAPEGAAVGAGARLRVGRVHLQHGRSRRTPGGAAVGAGERLPRMVIVMPTRAVLVRTSCRAGERSEGEEGGG